MSEAIATPIDTVSERTVEVGNLQTVYRRSGSGEPLLFLTGQGYAGRWIPLYEQLSTQFDVLVPDHPGFGGTELPDFILDFNDLAVHYAQFLDITATGPVHLVGHAFGGWIAAEFAAMYPERVRSLTLIAPSGLLPDATESMVDPYRMSREQWLDAGLGIDRGRWVPLTDIELDPGNQMLSDYKERTGVARVAWNPRYSFRLENRLQRVQAPAQVLVPEHDGLTAPSIARRYTELLGCAGPITIATAFARTEHLLILQAPEEITTTINDLAHITSTN